MVNQMRSRFHGGIVEISVTIKSEGEIIVIPTTAHLGQCKTSGGLWIPLGRGCSLHEQGGAASQGRCPGRRNQVVQVPVRGGKAPLTTFTPALSSRRTDI